MDWQDLPERKNCFTVRNAAMLDLKKNKAVRAYCANTRITVVQKCNTPFGTFYRTEFAKEQDLDWAFKASAFGLPNDKAPSAHSDRSNSLSKKTSHPKPATRKPELDKKQTSDQKVVLPKDGGGERLKNWFSKVFRRKNG